MQVIGITLDATIKNEVNKQANDILNYFRDRSSHHHYESPTFQGFWKKKFIWRPRWVKTWQEKKIYVAVWKRMWGPAVVKEWVPVPKPPPGWVKSNPGAYFVKVGVPH